MNYIKSFCKISQGKVWLNDNYFFEYKHEPFVLNEFYYALYEHLGIDYRKFFKMDRLSKLSFLAAEILLADSDREQPKTDMGIILFNKRSSLDADVAYQKTIQNKDDFFPSPAEFVYTLPNIAAGEIAIRNKIYGETMFYVMRHFYGNIITDAINDALYAAGINCVLAGWMNLDVLKNKVECLMMLCTTKRGKTENKQFIPYLPADFHIDRFDNFLEIFEDTVGDLYD